MPTFSPTVAYRPEADTHRAAAPPPSPRGPFGEAMQQRGRELVRAGVAMDQVVWDADEVLWDWTMNAARLAAFAPRRALRRDLGHREYVLVKPGVIELLVGMQQESLALGQDPRLRIWTNGYAWRLWRIAREIPGFLGLLGLPDAAGPEQVTDHPCVFTRQHYAAVIERLLTGRDDARLDGLPNAARQVLQAHLERAPLDSTLKLPELAALADKDGFARAAYLIDDYGNNIKRFVASGRRGVRVLNWTPSLMSRVPNTVWRDPFGTLQRAHTTVVAAVADALHALAERPAPDSVSVASNGRAQDQPLRFVIDVPDERLRGEWLMPMRRLRDAIQHR